MSDIEKNKKIYSFAELHEMVSVTAEQVRDTLMNCADQGAAISSDTVSIINKIELSPDDIADIRNSALKGLEDQGKRGFPEDQMKWIKVLNNVIRRTK